MKNFYFFLLLNIFKISVSLEDIWHSYQHNPNHLSREKIIVTNITSDSNFKLDFVTTTWKSLCLEKIGFAVGSTEKNLLVTVFRINSSKNGFIKNSYEIDLENKPVDYAIFEKWNTSTQNADAILVIATEKPELIWYKINENNSTKFWTWPSLKKITHINFFQINFYDHLLLINEYSSTISADIYEFEINKSLNFWLRQKINLKDFANSTSVINVGPRNYLVIPQKSLGLVKFYKFNETHFVDYTSLASPNVDHVVTFSVGQKGFVAFNGLNAGIYRFAKKDLVKESVTESHFEGVNYWLPIPLSVYGDDTILLAQRALSIGLHQSFDIELFTYNGHKFEEHEDISCYYFGEKTLGLACLPDVEAHQGIERSTSIFLDNLLGLIISRKNRSPDLFIVTTQLKSNPNPLIKPINDLLARQQNLNSLLEQQEDRFNKLKNRHFDLFSTKDKLVKMEKDINSLKNDLFIANEKTVQYETVIFNDFVKIENSGVFDAVNAEKINNEDAELLLNNIVLKNSLKPINTKKSFENLNVGDLFVEGKINEIASDDLKFSTDDKTIRLHGNLSILKPVKIKNVETVKVNGLQFEKEVVDFETLGDSLLFENLEIEDDVSVNKINDRFMPKRGAQHFQLEVEEYDNLYIPNNLIVENVNDENFENFLTQLCLKNIKNYIPGIFKVEGNVTVAEDAFAIYLNNLNFPDEFVFKDDIFTNITGFKNFSNTLTTSELNCDGKIDNISISKIITLSTNQEIPKTTTFKKLKVTESLNVTNIIGEHASKFLPNPTLFEKSFIKSKVHFKNLEVQGSIVVTDEFNGKNLEQQLSDVVYENEENPVIQAMKQFSEGFTVRDNLLLSSNSVNNISLDTIVTKNTEQVLNISEIQGVVTFGSVETANLYDSVDVRKLDEELVKLVGEQYISSTLIFEDEIEANRLEVLETINNLQDMVEEIKNQEHIEASNIYIEGDLNGHLENIDFEDIKRKKLSLNEDQFIESQFEIKELLAENLQPVQINNLDRREFIHDSWLQKLTTKILDGNLTIHNFHAFDSIEIDKINDKTAMNLGGASWEYGFKKHNITNLICKNNVNFESVQIEKLSGADFKSFIKNIVYKNESEVKISGQKKFLKDVDVEKLIETKNLNNVELPNILRKHEIQKLKGPLIIQGNVFFENNVTISEEIGNVSIDLIKQNYEFNNDFFKINGDVLFNRLAHVKNLQIDGYVGDKLAQNTLSGLIFKDTNFHAGGLIIFENKVKMNKNIRVLGKINNIDLPAFVSDMVMITKDTTISSSVQFTNDILIENQFSIFQNFTVNGINNVNIDTWLEKAIFVDKGLLRGTYQFENVVVVDSLFTETLNNVNMSTLIPLRQEQNLPELSFLDVSLFKDVWVGNSTNFRNLSSEFENTVMIDSDQSIDSDVKFIGNVFIEGDIEILGSLNGIKTERVVTTNTDQDLEAVYIFKSKISLDEDLEVEELVNGIDLEKWSHDAIKTSAQNLQNITDNWIVQELILEEDASGLALINSMNIKEFNREIYKKRNHKYEVEKGFIDDYRNLCKDLTFMHSQLKNQIYRFNYLETFQILNFEKKIDFLYNYEYKNNTYLIINEQKSCASYLFVFDLHFRYVRDIDLGHIAQIITVHSDENMYLVVQNSPVYSSCKIVGTNLWKVDEQDLLHVAIIEEQNLLQESQEINTFYGIRNNIITEFKVLPNSDLLIKKYRKWIVNEENMAFMPRGFATGLAIRTGRKLIRLKREQYLSDDFNTEFEQIIVGNFTVEPNTYLPGRKKSDFVVMKVGIKSNKRNLLAIASHEETSVKGNLDFIKIYEDIFSGKVFHKVASYKPSSLVSLRFNNGETLLSFLEDKSRLQVYEYKGIEGFQHKVSIKLEGSKLFTINVENKQQILGVIDKNKITFLDVLMLGNRVEENLQCFL